VVGLSITKSRTVYYRVCHWKKIEVGQYLASYKEEGGCLVDFVHIATISLKVEESERHNPPLLPVTMPDFFLIKKYFFE